MEKKMVLVAVEHNEQEFLPELDQVLRVLFWQNSAHQDSLIATDC